MPFLRKFYRSRILPCLLLWTHSVFAQCGPTTPSFTANLVGSPTGTWTSPSIVRDDTCCGATAPDKCLKITILLDQGAMGINFIVAAGAMPPGALFYQIGCGVPQLVGTPICLNGPGPHVLTFCKPGNNNNVYQIVSVPKPVVPDSILVRSGCTQSLAVSGFSVPTINWSAISGNTLHNTYLSCTSGCATVNVVPTGTPPAFVDYEVSGFGQSPCQADFYRDTVRVYFYSNLLTTIQPTSTTICFGNNSAILTASTSGGIGPYTYLWSNSSTSSSVTVGAGTYTVSAFDQTGCPPTTATAVVTSYSFPISAVAGPQQSRCKSSPTTVLNGAVFGATGGVWSGGSGTYSPSTSALNMTYVPSPTEVNNGSVILYLTTTGNSGCPAGTGSVLIQFQNPPQVFAGPDKTACFNNAATTFTGGISGFSATPIWSSTGTGLFSSPSASATNYTPSISDLNTGTIGIVLSSTNNGVCPAARDTALLIITPQPVVNAGSNFSVCSNGVINLTGSVTAAISTGSWSSNGTGNFLNQSALNTIYAPSNLDISTGFVFFYLTSTGNGPCLPVKDTVLVAIQAQPSVNISHPGSACSTNSVINLLGNITGITNTGTWSSTGSGTFQNIGAYNPGVYFLSAADQQPGVLGFTLSSTNNGACPPALQSININVFPQATLNAGPNQVICSTSSTIALNGTNLAPGTTTWNSNSNGGFINPFSLNTTYSLSINDILFGQVIFSLSASSNSACPRVSDTLMVRVLRQATVNAGPDINVCSDQGPVNLNGFITGVTINGNWTGNGSGTLSPASNPAVYVPGQTDLQNGSVTFILTSVNNQICPSDQDTLVLNIRRKPQLLLPGDSTICYKGEMYFLDPLVVDGGLSYKWTSSGTGTFVPNSSSYPVSYKVSNADLTNGQLVFVFNSMGNGPCAPVSTNHNLYLKPSPVASFAVSSPTLVLPNNTVQITNLSTGAETFTWSFGNGSSSANPNPKITYTEAGTYQIILGVGNQFGCSDSSSTDLLVISEVIFPTAFTPNTSGPNGGTYNPGDQSNDVFYPFTSGVVEYQLTIFNRWGEQLFVSKDVTIGWDGYFNGKLCQQDAYVWKVDIVFFNGISYSKTGSVTLLR